MQVIFLPLQSVFTPVNWTQIAAGLIMILDRCFPPYFCISQWFCLSVQASAFFMWTISTAAVYPLCATVDCLHVTTTHIYLALFLFPSLPLLFSIFIKLCLVGMGNTAYAKINSPKIQLQSRRGEEEKHVAGLELEQQKPTLSSWEVLEKLQATDKLFSEAIQRFCNPLWSSVSHWIGNHTH